MKYSLAYFHNTVWYIRVSLYPQSCLLPTGYGGVWELNWKLETLIWHQDMILLYPGYCLPGFKTSLALPVTNGVPLTQTQFLTHLPPRVTATDVRKPSRPQSPALKKSSKQSVAIGRTIPWPLLQRLLNQTGSLLNMWE